MRCIQLLAASLLLALGLTGPGGAQDVIPDRILSIARDVDLPGHDLRPILDTTLTACDASCRADPDCVAFTFNSRNGSCFPKSEVGDAETYEGALSGVFRNVDADIIFRANIRRADLSFLSDADLTAAYDQAEGLGQAHYAGLFEADEWRRSALNSLNVGNFTSAMRRMGAAVTLSDAAGDWLDYARYLLLIEPENQSEGRQLERRALQAATMRPCAPNRVWNWPNP